MATIGCIGLLSSTSHQALFSEFMKQTEIKKIVPLESPQASSNIISSNSKTGLEEKKIEEERQELEVTNSQAPLSIRQSRMRALSKRFF